MDTLQCAIVLAKLERFEWELARRHALGARYAELITASGAPTASTPLSSCARSECEQLPKERRPVAAPMPTSATATCGGSSPSAEASAARSLARAAD